MEILLCRNLHKMFVDTYLKLPLVILLGPIDVFWSVFDTQQKYVFFRFINLIPLTCQQWNKLLIIFYLGRNIGSIKWTIDIHVWLYLQGDWNIQVCLRMVLYISLYLWYSIYDRMFHAIIPLKSNITELAEDFMLLMCH